MPYMAAVWDVLANEYGCQIAVVHWDKRKLTPFVFTNPAITVLTRSTEHVSSMVNRLTSLHPDLLYVSGRMDKEYLMVARQAKSMGIPVVMGSDTQWKGNWRDILASLLKLILYKPYFTHAWVPGILQYEYVKRMGFKEKSIVFDLYSGNVPLFNSYYLKRRKSSTQRDIIFIGRLHEVKGIIPLIQVLQELKEKGIFKGKLWIFGNGPLAEVIPSVKWIKIMGFAKQNEFEEGIVLSSIFCLPSIEEPWGVVLHEMAAAGLPICCSDVCGAATAFVKHDYNGYIFKSGDWKDLREKLRSMLLLSDETLEDMSRRSYELAQSITPYSSARSLLSVIEPDFS